MDADMVIQDLNRRFAGPLPEFYKRRIVFWYDEDQEFADRLDEIMVNGAKVIALTDTNNFYVKKLLAVDDPTSNYLIYSPLSYESDEDNWLLDIELYSEEFRTDLVSMWMDEMPQPKPKTYTMDQGAYATAYSICRLIKQRSKHMLYDDELTQRDLYMYRRGEMQEYIRNHGILDSDIHHRLYQWVNNGNSVHDNPWGIRDPKRGLPCDYLEAMEIFYNR